MHHVKGEHEAVDLEERLADDLVDEVAEGGVERLNPMPRAAPFLQEMSRIGSIFTTNHRFGRTDR